MSRPAHRALRKLRPSDELLRRRAAGASLRELAPEAGVSHQALSAFFKRPEVVAKMRSLERLEHSAEAQRSTGRDAGRRAPAATAARATPRPEPERRRERPAGTRQPMRLGFLASAQTPPEHVNADGTVNLSKSAAARSGWNPPYNSPPPDSIRMRGPNGRTYVVDLRDVEQKQSLGYELL